MNKIETGIRRIGSDDPDALKVPFQIVGAIPRTEPMETLYEALTAMAQNAVAQDMEVSGALFTWGDDGSLGFLPVWQIMNISKQAAADVQEAVSRTPGVRACAFVGEIWVSQNPEYCAANGKAPADDPERGEAVMFSIKTANRVAWMACGIDRKTKTLEIVPFTWVDQAEAQGASISGRFVDKPKGH